MKGFIILFNGHEGTSPFTSLLNNFERVAVIHQRYGGWEPFDKHNSGAISLDDFAECFKLIYAKGEEIDIEKLNEIYLKTAPKKLHVFQKSGLVGLKMRPFNFTYLSNNDETDLLLKQNRHIETLKSLCKDHEVTVFFSLRRNIFKRALSRYHNSIQELQHLQFQVAQGLIEIDEIEKIKIDPLIFDLFIKRCIAELDVKRRLFREFKKEGISVFSLAYEDFIENPVDLFSSFFAMMGEKVTTDEIKKAIEKGTVFKRIHSQDISHYVTNHDEIMHKFGQYNSANLSIE